MSRAERISPRWLGAAASERGDAFAVSFDARADALADAAGALNLYALRQGLEAGLTNRLEVVFEELVANIIEHAAEAAGVRAVHAEAVVDATSATLMVADDGPEFDPTAQAPEPAPASLEAARIGGLGLRLVRGMADELVYERFAPDAASERPLNRLTVKIRAHGPHPA